MTRIQKLRYARAVLMTQDRIALRYQKQIRAELKKVSKELAESYLLNGANVDFEYIQKQHSLRLLRILEQLANDTSQAFKVFTLKAKKLFDNYVEQNIYDILSISALMTANTVSSNTIAIANMVIAQRMTTARSNPTASEPINVAAAIQQRIGGSMSASRAMTIARTETHKAANVSQYTRAEWAANEAELDVEVEWIATNDSRVRDNHRHADGQKRDIGQPFNVGGEMMKHPSDPSASAGNTINCRCVLGYDTK